MENQQHILLVANSYNAHQIEKLKKTIELFRNNGARFSLLYAIPQIPANYFQIPSMALLQEHQFQKALFCLKRIGDALQIPKEDQWVELGNFKTIITRTAAKVNAEFSIVICDNQVNKPAQEQAKQKLQKFAHAISY